MNADGYGRMSSPIDSSVSVLVTHCLFVSTTSSSLSEAAKLCCAFADRDHTLCSAAGCEVSHNETVLSERGDATCVVPTDAMQPMGLLGGRFR